MMLLVYFYHNRKSNKKDASTTSAKNEINEIPMNCSSELVICETNGSKNNNSTQLNNAAAINLSFEKDE